MTMKKVAVLAGDGIGPEIIKEAIKVLDTISGIYDIRFSYTHADVGGAAIDNHGEALPESTVKTCREADAVLFGIGGSGDARSTGAGAGMA